MDRWDYYKQAGMLPSTGHDCWLEYPWGEIGAFDSLQDLYDDESGEQQNYEKSGKWMLYYPLEELDCKWQEACEQFESRKLLHVHHLRIGTCKTNPLAPPDKRVLVLFIDSNDPLTIIEAGLSIVKTMKYFTCCFYKTNLQTKQSRQQGAKKFLYYIRPECHNADPEWILHRFFRTSVEAIV
jgi:hypothetical protein